MTDLAFPPNRLRVLRYERGWVKQRDVARRLGWSQSRYSLIETGTQEPTADDIERLVALFGVPKSKMFPKSKTTTNAAA
jgi:transcriptional regulator with XRE-family HTH domain